MRLEIGQSSRLRSQRMPKRMHAVEDRGTCKVTREEERLSSPPLAATGTSPLARQPQHICGRRKNEMRCAGQAVLTFKSPSHTSAYHSKYYHTSSC